MALLVRSVTRIGACFGGLDHRSWCDHWQRPPRYIGGGPPTSH